MIGELNEPDPKIPVRNRYITILCIVTFVISGMGVTNNVLGYFDADKQVVNMTLAMTKATADIKQNAFSKENADAVIGMVNSITSSFTGDNFRLLSIFMAVTSFICLIGGLLIWQLNKIGFHFYLVGTLSSILLTFLLMGSNVMSLFLSLFMNIFGILIAFFFAMNLRYMKD
ncbi:MAG: hypothetical protein HY305_05845 [Sphingobacteriales bacterium]|nr:hypothetical protein [Sphingobacteriales bacterium]